MNLPINRAGGVGKSETGSKPRSGQTLFKVSAVTTDANASMHCGLSIAPLHAASTGKSWRIRSERERERGKE